MQHYIDVVQDRSGNAIGNAIVTVKNNSSGQTAPTYSDSAGLIPLTSIMTANNGTFSFYIESGRYNISITKNGVLLNAINDIFITVTADYPTAMSQYDAIAGINLTSQTISADVLQGAMPTAMSYADAVAGTSTTPQSIAPNVLVASNIVQKYASVNNIPANFAGIAKVGTNLYVGDGTSVVAVAVGAGIMVNLTPSTYTDYATALANSTAIQAAIDSLPFGGTVKLTSPNNAPVFLAGTQVVTWGDTSQANVGTRSSPVCFTVSSNITIEAEPTQIFYKCWTTGDYISVTSQPVFMANKKALTSSGATITASNYFQKYGAGIAGGNNGITFSNTGATVNWTSGTFTTTAGTARSITAGSATWSSGFLYVYFDDTTTLKTTTSFITATTGTNYYPVAFYDGSSITVFGNTPNSQVGNFGVPRVVGFVLSSIAGFAKNDAFQIIGELSGEMYNSQKWVVEFIDTASNTIIAYTSHPVGTIVIDANTLVYPANQNVNVVGGIWDTGAKIKNDFTGAGAMNSMGFVFNKVNNLRVTNTSLRNGGMNSIYYCNIRGMQVLNHEIKDYAGGPQGIAPFYDVAFDNIKAISVDDSICTVGDMGYDPLYANLSLWQNSTIQVPRPRIGYSIKNMTAMGRGAIALYGSYSGEFKNIVVDNVDVRQFNFSGGVKYIWVASQSYGAYCIVTSNGKRYQTIAGGTSGTTAPSHTTGTVSDGSVSWTYLSADIANTLTDITLKNVTISTDGNSYTDAYGLIEIDGGANIGTLLIDNFRINNSAIQKSNLMHIDTNCGIDKLIIKNLTSQNGLANAGIVIYPGNTTTKNAYLNNLVVENSKINFDNTTGNTSSVTAFIQIGTPSGNESFVFKNSKFFLTGTGSTSILTTCWNVNGSGQNSINDVVYDTCQCTSASISLGNGNIRRILLDKGVYTNITLLSSSTSFVFSNIKSTQAVSGVFCTINGSNIADISFLDCNIDFNTASGTLTSKLIILGPTITVKNLLIRGGKYSSSNNSGSGSFNLIGYSSGATYTNVMVSGLYIAYGGIINSDGVSASMYSFRDIHFGGGGNFLAIFGQSGGTINITIDGCFADSAFIGGACLSTWGTGTTFNIAIINSNLSSSPLGINGTNNVEKLRLMGWLGSGAITAWGTTPTYTNVTALGT